jgi:hypothetical protein
MKAGFIHSPLEIKNSHNINAKPTCILKLKAHTSPTYIAYP